jgi:hypothetical protein
MILHPHVIPLSPLLYYLPHSALPIDSYIMRYSSLNPLHPYSDLLPEDEARSCVC